jgi:hypothetical protein
MSKFVTFMMMVLVLGFALSLSAQAQQSIGGHDETTEDLSGAAAPFAAGAAATPGSGGVVAGVHLLITEVGWRGLNSATCADSTEFVEIYNPTSSTVDLSKYYLCDVNAYKTLPVAGTISIAGGGNGTDFAMRFPSGSSIAPGAYKVVAIDGPRFKRCSGIDADFEMFAACPAPPSDCSNLTTALPMVDVATNKAGSYPAFGMFTNGGEFVWLFFWDGISDLVCDADLVYWGSATGDNLVARKLVTDCQDGPDADVLLSCYNLDAGNPAGSMAKGLTTPASGAGTRQRVTAEGAETLTLGNGCVPGGPTAVQNSTWGQIKSLYR